MRVFIPTKDVGKISDMLPPGRYIGFDFERQGKQGFVLVLEDEAEEFPYVYNDKLDIKLNKF